MVTLILRIDHHRLFLEFSADPGSLMGVVARAGAQGWFVYAQNERCCERILDVLWTILMRARVLGCAYVLFDAATPIVEDLSVFDENVEPKAISPLPP